MDDQGQGQRDVDEITHSRNTDREITGSEVTNDDARESDGVIGDNRVGDVLIVCLGGANSNDRSNSSEGATRLSLVLSAGRSTCGTPGRLA